MPESITIGSWAFAPDTGLLQKAGETRRLESRSAALLEMLCRSGGKLVSHADIIHQIWDDRAVSSNSVAVVISDIRRALEDDPREPQYIETLPKRGYRLVADVYFAGAGAQETPDGGSAPRRGRRIAMAGLAAAAFAIASAFLFVGNSDVHTTPLQISITPVDNQTGDQQYDALAISVSEVLTYELIREKTIRVLPADDAAIVVSGKLILWDGYPAMSLHAKSVEDGRILWSGMASGPETLLPKQVRAEIAKLAEASDAPGFGESAS